MRYKERLITLLDQNIISKNLMLALNTLHILIDSYGILKFSDAALIRLDTMMQTILSKLSNVLPTIAAWNLKLKFVYNDLPVLALYPGIHFVDICAR